MSHDVITNFIASMEAAGVKPAEPIADQLLSGKIVRFRAEGDKPGKRNAWAILYFDSRPAGAFGSYRMGFKTRWKANDLNVLSPAERQQMQREWAEARAKREEDRHAGHRRVAGEARAKWAQCESPNPEHPYLLKKGMSGENIGQIGEWLIVPMYDINGDIWNLQRIAPDGTKRFLKGGRTAGLFWIAGRITDRLCIGEGVATMAAVRKALGYPVVASFSAENLSAVATAWRDMRTDIEIAIFADDDAHLIDHPQIGKNLGLEAATDVARSISARLVVPKRIA